MEVYSNNMRDKFLSKQNMSSIYKTLLSENNYYNIQKNDKVRIINKLTEIMKNKLTKLNMNKINNNNIKYLTIQYNNQCLKEITSYVQKHMNLNNQEREFNQRKYNRDFQKFNDKPVINNLPEQTKFGGDLNERIKRMEEMRKQNTFQAVPSNNLNNMSNIYSKTNNFNQNNMNSHMNSVSNSNLNKPQNLMEKMAELEKSRGMVNDERPPTPEFLKSTQVGNKQSSFTKAKTPSTGSSFKAFNSDSNVVNVNFNKNKNNNSFDENISVEERLRMMEKEREEMLKPQQSMEQQPIQSMEQQPIQSMQQQPIQNIESFQPQNIQQQNINNEQQNINMELINHLNDNVEQFNIILEELSLLRTQVNNKHNYLQLEINKHSDEYVYKFKEISNVVGIKLISYSIPEQSYNFNDSTIRYKINGFNKSINLEKGYYDINTLLMKLNDNDSLHFSINYKKRLCVSNKTSNVTGEDDLIRINDFTFEDSNIVRKLGFNNFVSTNGILEAYNIIDFRNDTKLKLYLNNIDSNSPFGILNFNGTSLCDFSFKNPIKLNRLHILFKTINNQKYDFDNMMYNLSFQLVILK